MNGGGQSNGSAAGPPPPPPVDAAALVDAAWFGLASASPGSVERPTGPPERVAHGWLSWLFWGGGAGASGDNGRGSTGQPARRSARSPGAPKAARPRSSSDGTAGRMPRPVSASKLQSLASSQQQARSKGQPPAQQQQQGSQPAAAVAAAAPGPAQGQEDAAGRRFGSRPGSRTAVRQASYAERRQAWRQRIEQIKAKHASRATAPAGGPPGDHPPGTGAAAAAAGGLGRAPRVISKHVAIPLTAGGGHSRSGHSTPHGSPTRRELLSDASGAALPQFEAPVVWHGFQTAEAPADFAAASGDQLRRFLQQAGWPLEAVLAVPDHEALVAAARSARGAWEVERIMACTWPEEVLRVPRKCTDAAVLKTAYRRCSMHVHPDKCNAAGASDAMSILSDCYNVLMLAAASGGKPTAAVPAFMRQGHHPSSRAAAAAAAAAGMHTSGSAPNLAGWGSGAVGSAPGQPSAFGQPPTHQRRSTADPAPTSPLQPGVQQQERPHGGEHHSRHASGESIGMPYADSGPWAADGQQEPVRRSSSGPAEAPGQAHPHGRSGSGSSQDHWNPHARFSSDEAAAAGASSAAGGPAGLDALPLGVPSVGGTRSRASSASSLSAAAQASSDAGLAAGAAAPAPAPPSPSLSLSASTASMPGSLGSAGGPLQAAAEGSGGRPPLSRPPSAGSLAGASPRRFSVEDGGGGSGAWPYGRSSAAAEAGPAGSQQAPAASAFAAGAPPAFDRPGPAQGQPPRGAAGASGAGQRPASATAAAAGGATAGRSKSLGAGGLTAGGSKIRVTLKVRQQ